MITVYEDWETFSSLCGLLNQERRSICILNNCLCSKEKCKRIKSVNNNQTIKISQSKNIYNDNKLRVGDKYVVTENFIWGTTTEFYKDEKCTVCKIYEDGATVCFEFERENNKFHSCNKTCRNNHGWMFSKEYLKYFRKI